MYFIILAVTFTMLSEKTTVMSPEVLVGAGIPCCRCVQCLMLCLLFSVSSIMVLLLKIWVDTNMSF